MSRLASGTSVNMTVMAHRHKGSRSERVVSGQDLPEVVPWQDAPHRKPSERQSHAYPQVVHVDHTPLGEKLESRFSRFSLASERAPPPPSPTVSRKSSFVPKKRKHWIIFVVIVVMVALVIGIAAAIGVTLSQKSHKSAGTAHGSNNDGTAAAPDATSVAPSVVLVTTAVAPTATANATPTSASATAATSAPVCPNYVGPGIGDLPQSFPGQVTSAPPNTVHINVQFTQKMAWDRVSANSTQLSSIQSLVPQAFAFALAIDVNQIQMGALIPNDTAAELCYVQTVAQVYAPNQYTDTLESYAFNWSSPLFHSPNKDVYTLMSDMYNMTFPAD